MHRIGLPKVVLVPLSRPKKLSFAHKIVRIVSDSYRVTAALVPYKDFNGEVMSILEETDAKEYFTLDEQRFISHNSFEHPLAKKFDFIKERRIVSSSKDIAQKSNFYIYDTVEETYWHLL